jgi:hypothetical protein
VSYLLFGIGLLALLALWVGYMVYVRLTSGSADYPRHSLVSILAIFLIILLLLVIFRVVGQAESSSAILLPHSNNSSGSGSGVTPTQQNTSLQSNSSANYTLQGALPGLPKWAPYAILGVAVLVVTLVALPFMLSFGQGFEVARKEELRPGPVKAAMSSTLSELERDHSADPRALIIALYARLLHGLVLGLGPTDAMTAREIERVCVESFGVRPATARELTALFEEARYSTRRMGPGAAERARQALTDALRDLSSPRGARA